MLETLPASIVSELARDVFLSLRLFFSIASFHFFISPSSMLIESASVDIGDRDTLFNVLQMKTLWSVFIFTMASGLYISRIKRHRFHDYHNKLITLYISLFKLLPQFSRSSFLIFYFNRLILLTNMTYSLRIKFKCIPSYCQKKKMYSLFSCQKK